MPQVFCSVKYADGHIRPCKHRSRGKCSRSSVRLKLLYDDYTGRLAVVCVDEEEP